jgi:RNA polymerase sigma-70 factor, ECF subfamily
MDDAEQVRQCLAGDRNAFEPLVRQYKGLVFSLALHTLQDRGDASDATQDVFLKAWINLGQFDFQYTFKAWIARITVNHCINMNRKRKLPTVEAEGIIDEVPATMGLPEQTALDAERRESIREAVQALPGIYRTPVLLYHQQNLSYTEICQVMELPMTLVKNRLYRARKMLAEALAEHGSHQTAGWEGSQWVAQKHGNG